MKRNRETEIHKLVNDIHVLETAHKSEQTLTIFQELSALRGRLSTLLHCHHQRHLQHSKAFFYVNSDNGSRLLARLINNKKNKSYIAYLRDCQGLVQHLPDNIAKIAHSYYESLYSLESSFRRSTQLLR
ncbi:Hypothetical predicted protein [Pelobates cultripes]|uniref:Uncharacterized protein n=1 Tax=Pelobates cultripes TaxID=61616 RepID=A0AAD1T8D3_PELCU|nr:Hypothetical predicted protein [Pelobates cultripes]